MDDDAIKVIDAEGSGQLHDPRSGEVMQIVVDEMLGRMTEAADGDPSEFDAAMPREVDQLDENEEEQEDDVSIDGESDEPAPFQEPAAEEFPVFKAALRRFQASESKPKIMRVDTDETYDKFVCERAVKELARRVQELRSLLEAHLSEHEHERHPGYKKPRVSMRNWDEVLGAAEAIQDLHKAKSASEALEAMETIPVDMPAFANGKVKCWKEGNAVVCSMRFSLPDGRGRIATMAAKPSVDAEEFAGWAARAGVHPVHVLGALGDLADVACAKRLVKEVAGAALAARHREDVRGMAKDGTEDPSIEGAGAEPLLLAQAGDESRAPLAALMHVEQRANAGDKQASTEMAKIRSAAKTPLGKRVAAPLLAESSQRLAAGRARKVEARMTKSFAGRYALMSMGL